MTNYAEMKAAYAKLDEIKGGITALATEIKQKVDAGISKIKANDSLSPIGKTKAIEALRREEGKAFISRMKQLRHDFDSAAIKAEVKAEAVLNEPATKPADISIKTFERQLAAIKTDLLLATNADNALQLVDSFVDGQKEPYFAQQLQKEMPSFIGQIVTLAGADGGIYKNKLRRTVDALNDKAMTPEQKEAALIHVQAGQRFGEDLFFAGGVQLQAVRNAVGDEFTRHANKPQNFIDTETE